MSERLTAHSQVRPDASRPRASLVVLVLSFWMLGIGVRLAYLQVGQGEWLSARARRQQQQNQDTNAVRGLIFDRAGRELARSLEVDSFFVVPAELTDVRAAAAQLAPVLQVAPGELEARLRRAQTGRRKFMWLARQLDAAPAARLAALQLAGVYARKETKRYYPNGPLAAHILGFVGLDDAGLAGVEQVQDAALKGAGGRVQAEGDGLHRAYDSNERAARDGRSVVLTIDQNVQYQTEQALTSAVAQTHAKSGTAIVLDPHTGEILALANAPAFDPNDARRRKSQTSDDAADAARPPADVLRNPALENIYEPGSTFKIVAFSAALEERLVQPGQLIDCQMGAINVFGRIVHDAHPHGVLTVSDALAQSSNVAAIKLGLMVGNERLYDYIRRFGFGARTGVELPGEAVGLVRRVRDWQPSSIGSIPMGQEVGVTALQVAAAFGALANDGVRVQPHLIKEVREADGTPVARAAAESHRVVSAATAQTMRPMLESVTLKGTAKLAQVDGYTAAGKTGTAQKIDPRTHTYSRTKYVASFVGFAPVEHPAVVIIVMLDEPVGAYYGGAVAAPVFSEIAANVLPYLNVEPDAEVKRPAAQQLVAQTEAQPYTAAASESAAAPASAGSDSAAALWPQVARPARDDEVREVVFAHAGGRALLMPDLRGRSVRDAARICAALGLEFEAHGDGRAVRQSPAAGARIESGQVVRIDFGRSD